MVTKHAVVIVAGTLLLALLVTGVSAAQSQGLRWGFEKGEQYYFTQSVQNLGEAEPSQTDLMFICDDYPLIQDPLTDYSSLPWASFQTYFTNGSPTDTAIGELRIAVPIGNWSLLSEMFARHSANNTLPQNATPSFRIVEDNEQWGYIWEWSLSSPQTNFSVQYSYSTRDGVLTQFSMGRSLMNNEAALYTITRLPMDPQLQSTLTTGAALGIVVMAIAVYARTRRH